MIVEDGVLVLVEIHVVHRLPAAPGDPEAVDRVHGAYAGHCPVARSLRGAIAISSEWSAPSP